MDKVTQAQEWQRFAAMDLESAEYLPLLRRWCGTARMITEPNKMRKF